MEKRNLLNDNISAADDLTIEGYAAVFNKRSHDLGGFVEVIDPGAFDGVIERSDVLLVLNHDDSRGVFGRSKNGNGTLELSIDETGLKYRCKLSEKNDKAVELYDMIKRGDITTSSFCFTILKDKWVEENGQTVRHIQKIGQLYDVSPVYHEAYPDTSVSARQKDDDMSKLAYMKYKLMKEINNIK